MKKNIFAVSVAMLLVGCAAGNPYVVENNTVSNTTKGVGVGAVTGAAIGALTAKKEDRVRNALIGAGVGGAAGGGVGYYMDRQEQKLREKLARTGVGVQRNGNVIQLIMPSNITFDSDQWVIQSNFQPILRDVGVILNNFPETAVNIQGHTDSTGSSSHNMSLSQNRAQAVAQTLMNYQIPAHRLRTQGFGEDHPIADNFTEEGKAQNRRVEIHISPLNG